MEDKNKELRILLRDVDQEYYRLDPYMQVKFAIEQISVWQQKFNNAKDKIPKEKFVYSSREDRINNKFAEIKT